MDEDDLKVQFLWIKSVFIIIIKVFILTFKGFIRPPAAVGRIEVKLYSIGKNKLKFSPLTQYEDSTFKKRKYFIF